MSIDFGKGPLDRLLEEDRRRRKMFEEIARPFGGASELARIGRDHAMTVRQFDSVIGGPTFRAMREITEQNRRFADQVRALVTPSYLDSLKETARALSSALPEMDARTNDLSRTLGPSFRAVSEALDIGASMRALVDTTRWMETLGAVSMAAASMQPTLDAFARSIESQWMREATTLRASRTATEIEIDAWALRQETNSANEALAKLAASDTPVDQLRWITSFFQAIARLFDHFQTNTVKEIQQAGLFFMLSAALMLAEVLDRIEDSDFGPSDRTELREAKNGIHALREQLLQLESTISEGDTKFLEGLPRAEVRRHANVRLEPMQSSARIQRLQPGEIVAVAGRSRRWRHIIFRDPLSGRLAMGWVYSTSLDEN